jgi:hypothetical protein
MPVTYAAQERKGLPYLEQVCYNVWRETG